MLSTSVTRSTWARSVPWRPLLSLPGLPFLLPASWLWPHVHCTSIGWLPSFLLGWSPSARGCKGILTGTHDSLVSPLQWISFVKTFPFVKLGCPGFPHIRLTFFCCFFLSCLPVSLPLSSHLWAELRQTPASFVPLFSALPFREFISSSYFN